MRRVLPLVIEGTENLVLLGLPKDALHFLWYEHGKAKSSHAHCALTLSLLPRGGPFEFKKPKALLQYFDRLAGLALGLSDPADPRRARLVSAGTYSNRKENKNDIEEICRATAAWWRDALKEHTHQGFIKLITKDLGYKLLWAPAENGQACFTETRDDCRKKYSRTVGVENRSGTKTIVLKGEVCRPWFSAARWNLELKKRQELWDYLHEYPRDVYDQFVSLLKATIENRRQVFKRFLKQSPGGKTVGIEDFAWLEPSDRSPGCKPPQGEVQEDPLSWALDITYPFYSEYEDRIPVG
ncbi:MAG TPA: hypothetical protein VKY92_10815 [Verrucomicrobiae bacterium]|nr:hypothetical protein [Verrucomicrobiae bacterium]